MYRPCICFSALVVVLLGGCDPNPLQANTIDSNGLPREGNLEINIISNIRCEVQNAIYQADAADGVPYLKNWGTQVTMKLTWDEMSSISPGVSIIQPLVFAQSFSFGLGGTGSAHATRLETVSFIWENQQLLADAKANARIRGGKLPDCRARENGVFIEGDLKIGDFISDKDAIVKSKVASTNAVTVFNTYQEDITFVAAFGANATPTWKFARVSADTVGNFVGATRTTTGDVLITLGPLAQKGKSPALAEPAASQHVAGIIGGSTASQIASRQ